MIYHGLNGTYGTLIWSCSFAREFCRKNKECVPYFDKRSGTWGAEIRKFKGWKREEIKLNQDLFQKRFKP